MAAVLVVGLVSLVAGAEAQAQGQPQAFGAPSAPLSASPDFIEAPTFVDPRELTRFRDGLLFNAWHRDGGQALWWLDASNKQVRLLTPPRPGFRGAAPGGFVVWEGLA